MLRKTHYFLLIILLFLGCSLWEYDNPSQDEQLLPPETYLSLVALDTIYASIDTVVQIIDPNSGETITDTLWNYNFSGDPNDTIVWDTIPSAFTNIMTSRQEIHWWGEDSDGEIIGYFYKWSSDSVWTFTHEESGLFFIPIRTELDIFDFQVKAMDRDSLVDNTPAKIVLPIQNSSPEISFRYRSNPLIADLPNDTSFTFPTRTFVWDIYDQDGNSSITDVYYVLDDPCDTCWNRLDAAVHTSITLIEIEPGLHTFYLKAKDIAGAESIVTHFPDTNNIDEPDYWKVKPVVGNVLLVDDFPQNSNNAAQSWYRSALDTILDPNGYSVWEIGDELPFSATDVSATLDYFDHVIWFSAYTGIETYLDASGSIMAYVANGGNIFINTPELKDSTFTWFPIESSAVINPNGRLFPGTVLNSEVDDIYNLETSTLIAIRFKYFIPDSSQFSAYQTYYRIDGKIVAAGGKFQVSHNTESGNVVLMSIPIHNGTNPIIEGNGSASKFIDYLLSDVFAQ